MAAALLAFVTSTAGMSWLVSCSIKAALLLAASGLGAVILRRGTAAARHQLWTLGVVAALLLPLVCWMRPSRSLPSAASTIASAGALDAPALRVAAGPATGAPPTWPGWLAIVWAAGALVVAFPLVRRHVAARRLSRAADPQVAASWSAALREARAALALAKRIRIRLLRSDAIGSPMTIGVLRPRVLLPAAADAWSPARLRAVLVHELGHVRRRDTAIQLAAQLACAIYWWNPLAWLAAARLRIEREHACDDLVLGAGILPSSYAADLLAVARSISTDAHGRAGAIGMVDRSGTEARLRRVLDGTAARLPPRARFRLAVSGLALAGVVTLACTSSPPVIPPVSLGTLSLGAPFVRDWDMLHPPVREGDVDLSQVATEVQRRLGDLEQCYQRQLAVEPTLSGTVVMHWTIAETGEVADTCITSDTVHDDAVAACVNQLVRAGRFPAPQGGAVDVSFPFVFTARAAAVAPASLSRAASTW
jgi:beta-lactamase regulating signal transducer with metallopeptidase domain